MAPPEDGKGSVREYDPAKPEECTKPHPEVNGVTVSSDYDDEKDPNEPKGTCEQIQKLLVDAGFQDKLNDLKNATNNYNYEIGYKMKRKADGTYAYTYVQGLPNSGQLDNLSINSFIDGFIHSHYAGQNMLSIFSMDDIFALGQLLSANLINSDNFVFGVVTFGGTYLLSISDPGKLLNYINGIDFNDENLLGLKRFSYGIFVNPDQTVSQNEIGLLNFIRTENLGLELHKGNTIDFNEWNKLGSNRQGTNTINLTCN